MDVLRLEGAAKSFGTRRVLEDVSFSVPEHCIYGFIGENGAGKTTTMKLILGLLRLDSGQIQILGEPVRYGGSRTNRLVGYLPDVPAFYDFLTPEEYMQLCGRISGLPADELRVQTEELLRLVGLAGVNRRIQGFSRGMKQRLGIAQALLGRPRLLICDEPTSALDPAGRREILDLLSEARQRTTVLFSTHILSDVERICDRVAVLRHGQVALEGSLSEVRRLHRSGNVEIELEQEADALLLAEQFPKAKRSGRRKVTLACGDQGDMNEVLAMLAARHMAVQRVEMMERSLEDLFMEVIEE